MSIDLTKYGFELHIFLEPKTAYLKALLYRQYDVPKWWQLIEKLFEIITLGQSSRQLKYKVANVFQSCDND